MAAAGEKIIHTKTKSGKTQVEKTVYVVQKVNDLKSLDLSLYDEIKDQQDPVIQISELSAFDSVSKVDIMTILVHDTVYTGVPNSHMFKFIWKFDTTYSADNYWKITGQTRFSVINDTLIKPLGTDVIANEFGFKLVTGIKKVGKTERIFVTSTNPNFHITDLSGADLKPAKPKKWGIGFQFGPSIGFRYNGVSANPYIGVGLGFGINHNIIRF